MHERTSIIHTMDRLRTNNILVADDNLRLRNLLLLANQRLDAGVMSANGGGGNGNGRLNFYGDGVKGMIHCYRPPLKKEGLAGGHSKCQGSVVVGRSQPYHLSFSFTDTKETHSKS